jgi:hypothetical protein
MLPIHLLLGLPSGLFHSGFPTNILCIPLLPHSCYVPCPSHPLWLNHSNYAWRRVQVMKRLRVIWFYNYTDCERTPCKKPCSENRSRTALVIPRPAWLSVPTTAD